MAFARVGSQDATGVGTTTATATYPVAPTAGNLLIAVVGSNSTTAAGLSTGGWTAGPTSGSGTGPNIALFYKIAAGTEGAIAATGATQTDIAIFEYSGLPSAITLDGTGAAKRITSTVTTLTTNDITTINPNDLIFSAAFVLNAPNTTSGFAWTKGSTIGLTGGAQPHVVCGEHILTAQQSGYNNTLNWTGAVNCAAAIIAFQTTPVYLKTSFNNYEHIKAGDGISVSEKTR